MRYKFKTEISLAVNQQIEKMRRRLAEHSKEEKLKSVEQKIETIFEEL